VAASPVRGGAVSLAALVIAVAALVPFRADRTAAHPSQAPTATATSTPSDIVVGSVTLRRVGDPGICRPLEFQAVFTATSAVAPVDEMRALFDPLSYESCDDIRNLIQDAPWEPFVAKRTYYSGTGYHERYGVTLGAQYRDASGNVSPVCCDWVYDICMPTELPSPTPTHAANPTPTPTPWRAYAPMVVQPYPRPSPSPSPTPSSAPSPTPFIPPSP